MIRNAFLVFVALVMASPPAHAVTAPDRVYEVDISLVGCAVCRKKMKEIFLALDNVKACDFDLTTKKAIITMNGDKTLTKAVVENAFKDTKYLVTSVVERKAAESKPAPGHG
jgi:hypothetical protein